MFKRLISFGSALVLSFTSLLVVLVPHAFAATRTWDGGGGDSNFTTAANWSGDVAPSAGDALVFDGSANGGDHTPHNDMTAGTSFASITFQGIGADDFTLDGNDLTLTGGITVSSASTPIVGVNITLSGSQSFATSDAGASLYISGNLAGSGDLTKTGPGSLILDGTDNSSYTGVITASAGSLYSYNTNALGDAAHGTQVSAGADLFLTSGNCSTTTATYAEPLTLTGASSAPTGDLPTAKLTTNLGGCGGGGVTTEEYGGGGDNSNVFTLSGNITLGSDVTVASNAKTVVSGTVSGGFNLNLVPGYVTQWVVGGTTSTPATFTKTLTGSSPSNTVTINGGAVITITGTRGAVTINGGTLKGSGTVGAVSASSDSHIAPGNSPGCLNTGNLSFSSGSSLDIEIAGNTVCTEHDQLNVTGTVNVTDATLNTTLLNGFTPKSGDNFVIVANDGTDPVTGTFTGLAEGATFTVGSTVFKITYAGGTGNDIMLTAQGTAGAAAPAAPNTGFGLIRNNPVVVLALTVLAAGGAMLASKKYAKVSVKR
jgi:autotransporter-associated beta strand protein